MVLLGLILVAIAIAAGVLLVVGAEPVSTPVDLDLSILQVSLQPLGLLVAGAAAMLLLWLGLVMIRGSVRRRRRPGREAKEAQRQAEVEENIRADERARAEETHQSALAERDRVREEEFTTRLADRDRLRDDEERTRADEAEARIRADERARVERELRDRQADAGHGAGTTAGVAAAGVGGAAAGAAATHEHHDREHDREGDRGLDSTPATTGDDEGDHASAQTERVAPLETTPPATHDSNGSTEPAGATTSGDVVDPDPDASSDGPQADTRAAARAEREAAAEEAGGTERHRTMADKIMGRGPSENA